MWGLNSSRGECAYRYGEKKTFLDLSTGFRVEDHYVSMLKVIPGPLTKLFAAADVVFSEAADAPGCWCCKGTTTTLCRCTRCKLARYCDKECQMADWVSHKQVCKYVVHIRELVGQGSEPFTLESFDDWVSFPQDGEHPSKGGELDDEPSGESECDCCGKTFTTERGRDMHYRMVHCCCDRCGREFERTILLVSSVDKPSTSSSSATSAESGSTRRVPRINTWTLPRCAHGP